MSETHSEATLSVMIERRYCAPGWAYLPQVRNGTGFVRAVDRTADGIAMSLWPSRGLFLHGFEIKVSRADWLTELKKPEKADEIASFCDYWWLVVANDKIVRAGELPTMWGLYVAKGDKLHCEVEAKQLVAKPLDRAFLAAIFRRIHKTVNSTVAMKAQYQKGIKDGEHSERNRAETEINRLSREVEKLKNHINVFEKNCGIDITKYAYHNPSVLAKAFRVAVEVESGAVKYQLENIAHIRDRLTEILENIQNKEVL